jgi:hypothetical protein
LAEQLCTQSVAWVRLPYARVRISFACAIQNKRESRDERQTFADASDVAETSMAQAFSLLYLLHANRGAAE